MDPRLANMLSFVDPIRLINLLGYAEGLAEAVGERTDALEPCELAKEKSGPRLDLGLSCCEGGRSDSRLIQELCEEIESLPPSVELGVAASPDRTNDCRLLLDGWGEVICLCERGGRRSETTGWEHKGDGCGCS